MDVSPPPPAANSLPSLLQSTELIQPVCRRMTASSAPLRASQIRTAPSLPADARLRPSLLHDTDLTSPLGPATILGTKPSGERARFFSRSGRAIGPGQAHSVISAPSSTA